MKKLIVLPNINGNFGKSPNRKLYHYDFNNGIIKAESYDIYLVDTELPITKNSWFVMNNELIHSSDIMVDDLVDYDVVIASTDFRTKLPAIEQVDVDAFLESNCQNNVVETMEFGDGNHTVMLVSDSLTNQQICEDYPIQDDIWTSRRWYLDHTDYCDLSGFENEWIGVDTTLDLDILTTEDLV